jgi:hypothetical protein
MILIIKIIIKYIMSAYDETVNFLKLHNYYSEILKYNKNDNWLIIFIDVIAEYSVLKELLLHFLKIKNKKILDDFKKIINTYKILEIIYLKVMFSQYLFKNMYDLFKNLIYLGANVNSDLIIEYDINNIIYLQNAIKELEKVKVNNIIIKTFNFDNIKNYLKIEENKLSYYNLINQAYYAQKINRFIKYYYDDKYRLTKFRLKIEENKYLRLIKDIPDSS